MGTGPAETPALQGRVDSINVVRGNGAWMSIDAGGSWALIVAPAMSKANCSAGVPPAPRALNYFEGWSGLGRRDAGPTRARGSIIACGGNGAWILSTRAGRGR